MTDAEFLDDYVERTTTAATMFLAIIHPPSASEGWASLMAATLLLAGEQLIMLGLLGEYFGRLFLTVNRKPQFVIRDIERNQRSERGT